MAGRSQPGLREWVARCFQSQPLWRVHTAERHWFCPYCGKAGFQAAPDDDLVERATAHLSGACEAFGGAGSAPRFSHAALQARALPLRIRGWLAIHPAWRVRDGAERWVCPYCLETTGVSLSGGKVTRAVLEAIVAHVSDACSAYRPEAATHFHALEDVHDAVAGRGVSDRLLEQVALHVRTQDVWQVLLGQAWVCPYCRRAVHAVSARSAFELQNNAPPQILAHLTRDCSAYQQRRPVAGSAERLLQAAQGRVAGQTTRLAGEPARAEELGSVSQVMESVQADLSRQAEEMERELAEAQRKQRSMLPDLPRIDGLQFHVLYEPSHVLAGDFYDFIELDEGLLGIAVGDVTGHGVNAALVMGMCKKVLNLVARFASSPAHSIRLANEEIIKDLDGKTFVTLWYGELDPRAATLRFVRAGHEPLLLHNPRRDPPLQSLRPGGMAVGLTGGSKFNRTVEEQTLRLLPGDLCLLYTDGLTEATSPGGEEFGVERLHQLLSRHGARGARPEALVGAIRAALRLFTGGEELADDLTLLAFRYQ